MTGRSGRLISRREMVKSLAGLTAGALALPFSHSAASTGAAVTRFAVLGDFGTGDPDEYGIARQMLLTHQKRPLDFVLTAGDNIYPNGSGKLFVSHFELPFAGLLKERVPFYAVLGNHDVEAGRQDQLHYPLFNMNGNNYYLVSKGNGLVDFFMLDTTDLTPTQLGWLEYSLQESRARWKVAVTHHPLYSSGKKHGSDADVRAKLEPVFRRRGVQVVFSGHDHIYERTYPQNGIQYFVTGAGGQIRRGGVDMKSPLRAASYDKDNHFMVIDLDEDAMAFAAISEEGVVIDSGIIKQG